MQLDISSTEFLESFETLQKEIFALVQISVVGDSLTLGKNSIICKWNDKQSCDICIAPSDPPEGDRLRVTISDHLTFCFSLLLQIYGTC
jgi:hypothetical protein